MTEWGISFFQDCFKKLFIEEKIDEKRDVLNSGDENIERGNWSQKSQYILSVIGCTVGLGNIWRFPYLVYKNGGGAFLIPYFVMLIVAGMPVFFMESALGQFCSQGPVNVWRAVPLFQGIGVTSILVTLLISVYYNAIIAHSLFYMFSSLKNPLPWSDCFEWAGSLCSLKNLVFCNISGVVTPTGNNTCPLANQVPVHARSPNVEFWDIMVLQRSAGIGETGKVVWHLALCLLLSSILVVLAQIKGIKSTGRVVYFTAIFPYVVILKLLIRGVTLEGAQEGLQFYLGSKSDLTKLGEAQVWKDAATQIFYTLSIGFGGVMTLASYNNFNNNMYKDTIVLTITTAATSVIAGFAIFSILGHMAHVYKVPVNQVVKEGFGLAFIAYPNALSTLPFAQLWSFSFFFMLVTVGLDTLFIHTGALVTCVYDSISKKHHLKRVRLTVAIMFVVYLLGLICVTQAGIFWISLVDYMVTSWMMPLLIFFEVTTISFIYGINRFQEDIRMMIGEQKRDFWLWWSTCWHFLTPVVILILLLWSITTYVPPKYEDIAFPNWSLALGWCLALFVLMWIPIVAVYKIMFATGTYWERVKLLCLPSVDWHPYLDIHRGPRYAKRPKKNTKAVKKT